MASVRTGLVLAGSIIIRADFTLHFGTHPGILISFEVVLEGFPAEELWQAGAVGIDALAQLGSLSLPASLLLS